MNKKEKYIDFINKSISIQNWLKNAPSQLLDYGVYEDSRDGLLKISILLKNSYYFED